MYSLLSLSAVHNANITKHALLFFVHVTKAESHIPEVIQCHHSMCVCVGGGGGGRFEIKATGV